MHQLGTDVARPLQFGTDVIGLLQLATDVTGLVSCCIRIAKPKKQHCSYLHFRGLLSTVKMFYSYLLHTKSLSYTPNPNELHVHPNELNRHSTPMSYTSPLWATHHLYELHPTLCAKNHSYELHPTPTSYTSHPYDLHPTPMIYTPLLWATHQTYELHPTPLSYTPTQWATTHTF